MQFSRFDQWIFYEVYLAQAKILKKMFVKSAQCIELDKLNGELAQFWDH